MTNLTALNEVCLEQTLLNSTPNFPNYGVFDRDEIRKSEMAAAMSSFIFTALRSVASLHIIEKTIV